jgi:hypothetical protein
MADLLPTLAKNNLSEFRLLGFSSSRSWRRLVLEGNFRSLNHGYLPPVSEFPLFYLAVHVPMPYMAQAPLGRESAGAG